MMKHVSRLSRIAALLVVVALISACAVFAGAAAGTAAGLGAVTYINDQTATTKVNANVSTTASWTEAVYRDMHITVTKRKYESNKIELTGKSPNGLNVTTKLKKSGKLTTVEVTATRSAVEFDKDYARKVVERIMAYGG